MNLIKNSSIHHKDMTEEEVRDVSGTPTTVSTNTFEYDRENRLIEQTVDSNQNVTVANAYDGLGRLVRPW